MSKSAKKILDTAERLFYQNSIHAVGVDLIRDQSGCSKTTLYTYFKNKDQLVEAVLVERDAKFKQSLLSFVGDSVGLEAIDKIHEWHMRWFKEDDFKGCLFVRAVAESDQDLNILEISQQHKVWIRDLIAQHTQFSKNHHELTQIVYTVIEGLISRFLVEGFDENLAKNTKNTLNKILATLS